MFAAAGLTAAFMPQVGTISNDVARTVTGALVGGTNSEATGGKFANGAVRSRPNRAASRSTGCLRIHSAHVSDRTKAVLERGVTATYNPLAPPISHTKENGRFSNGVAQIRITGGTSSGYQTMLHTLGHEAAHAHGVDIIIGGCIEILITVSSERRRQVTGAM